MFQRQQLAGGGVKIGRALQSRFEVDAHLGRGGLGDLYRVRALGTDDALALRVTEIPDAPAVLDAFGTVVDLTHRLAHLPIVRMRACGGDDGRAWYVTDFSPGESLLAFVRRRGPLPVADAVRLIGSAADAVASLHDADVVHQDLSPRNLFVDGERIKLLELGVGLALARLVRDKPGLITTPRIRAPEQLVSLHPYPRTDIYALGAVLYYLVTGRRALPDGAGKLQIATAGGVSHPALGRVPEAVRPILERALAMRPDRRFGTAREFGAALQAARSAP